MALIVTLSGSPSATSRTLALARHVGGLVEARGHQVASISVRDLDPTDLLHARVDSPSLKEAFALVERADAVVVSTPVYKASFSGILKSFLDLLPQFGLAGKVVLPLATGGTIAHVLAIDYAIRPVLASLGAQHIVNGLFILDKTIEASDVGLRIDADVEKRLHGVIDDFLTSVTRRGAIRIPQEAVVSAG
jgi:FMN reductase